MNLADFLRQLQAYEKPLSLDAVKSLLSKLTVQADDVRELVTFQADHYVRNRIALTEFVEALFLCFEAGQRTPIHDHAGSACGVKVIEGVATETIFERTRDGWLFATESKALLPGGVVGSNDMDTHQLSNLQTGGKRLVTLHIYSPPLSAVGNYSLTDNQVQQVRAAVNDLTQAVQV
jgi:cysteine dioxygenase